MIVDALERAGAFFPGDWWPDAAMWLARVPALPDGDHPVRGTSVFMKVMTFTTKPDPAPITESHRAYADIHVVAAGAERIRVWSAATLPVRQAYDADKDLILYSPLPQSPVTLDLTPGYFALLLPQDAHMPTIAAGAPAEIRKVVFKVSTALLPTLVTP